MRTAGIVALMCLVVVLSTWTFANADGGTRTRSVQPMEGDPEHPDRAWWERMRATAGDPEYPERARTPRSQEGDPELPHREWLELLWGDPEFPDAPRLVRHLVRLFAATP